ncbi:MAG: hypothetical protein ACYDA1_05145 [Vulcanimicrobiaceae bacterium]
MTAFDLVFGHRERARLRLSILGYAHPDIAEPEGFDLLDVRLDVSAGSVVAEFSVQMHDFELTDLADYLVEIVSGNGPARALTFAGGMLELSFAPSRRGPVLLGVILKEVDDAHLRLEYLVTLEPHEIGQVAAALGRFKDG